MSLIRVENLTKDYTNEGVLTPVLHGIDFVLEQGEFVAIMGPSGSGKSTLMHILSFLDSPTSGLFEFEGQDTKDFNKDYLAQLRNERIGFVFQSFNLLPRATVLRNVMLPLIYAEVKEEERVKRAKTALQGAGLDAQYYDHLSNQLSGGQIQRVAIARALVNNPSLILADEPTGALDSKTGEEVMNLLIELSEKESATIVIVTHDMSIAKRCKRIIKMKDGAIIKD